MTVGVSRHGDFDVVSIESDDVRVSVVPDFGAKVIDLTDKRTGRNWLVTGSPTDCSGDDAVFGGAESYGWDECFPTVAPCSDPNSDRPLRDHGALWARPWKTSADDTVIATTFVHADYSFSRRLTLDGDRVTADYTLQSHVERALPYLWSAHPLFALHPGETLVLGDTKQVSATYVTTNGQLIEPSVLDWPDAKINGRHIHLSRVDRADAGFAAKLYCDGERRVAIDGDQGALVVTWHGDTIGSLGIWLDYGGWPDNNPVHQVAIEPTTAPADDLQSAIAIDRQCVLQPQQSHRWSMGFALDQATDFAASETRDTIMENRQ